MAAIFAALGLLPCCAGTPPLAWSGPQQSEAGVRFTLRAPSAHRVQVVGSWEGNAWGGLAEGGGWLDPQRGAMADRDGDGIWERTVRLESGIYAYRFVVDGTLWMVDPSNPERTGRYGSEASIVTVHRAAAVAARH